MHFQEFKNNSRQKSFSANPVIRLSVNFWRKMPYLSAALLKISYSLKFVEYQGLCSCFFFQSKLDHQCHDRVALRDREKTNRISWSPAILANNGQITREKTETNDNYSDVDHIRGWWAREWENKKKKKKREFIYRRTGRVLLGLRFITYTVSETRLVKVCT